MKEVMLLEVLPKLDRMKTEEFISLFAEPGEVIADETAIDILVHISEFLEEFEVTMYNSSIDEHILHLHKRIIAA